MKIESDEEVCDWEIMLYYSLEEIIKWWMENETK